MGYAAMRFGLPREAVVLSDVGYWDSLWCYAMWGTGIGYAADGSGTETGLDILPVRLHAGTEIGYDILLDGQAVRKPEANHLEHHSLPPPCAPGQPARESVHVCL
eukprot:1582595-Rhodomonas_salina.2